MSNLDWSALKDSKTTLPGLGLVVLTILILAGKLPVDKLPLDYILGIIFGGSGVALLGINSQKPGASAEQTAAQILPAGPATPPAS